MTEPQNTGPPEPDTEKHDGVKHPIVTNLEEHADEREQEKQASAELRQKAMSVSSRVNREVTAVARLLRASERYSERQRANR